MVHDRSKQPWKEGNLANAALELPIGGGHRAARAHIARDVIEIGDRQHALAGVARPSKRRIGLRANGPIG
jgi:hypothetical protein